MQKIKIPTVSFSTSTCISVFNSPHDSECDGGTEVFGMEGTGESAEFRDQSRTLEVYAIQIGWRTKKADAFVSTHSRVMVGMWVGPGDYSVQSFLLGWKKLTLWDSKEPCSQSETGICLWNISEEPGV